MNYHENGKLLPLPIKRKSPKITPEMAGQIKSMLNMGVNQHDIASHFKVNQGRISEVNTGKCFVGAKAVQLDFFH